MPSIPFSQAVVVGLRKRGRSKSAIRELIGVSEPVFEKTLAGKKSLSARSIEKIEVETAMTGGELAALTLEPSGGPLTRLMNGFGNLWRDMLRDMQSKEIKRSAKRAARAANRRAAI